MVETLPLFPLGTVLLPGASLPLHIFEPRYRQLVVDLVTGAVPDRTFGVVAIRPGHDVAPSGAVAAIDGVGLHGVGCSAVLQEAKRLPDGRFDVLTSGARRFRLLSVDTTSAQYLIGTVEYMPDAEPAEDSDELLPFLAAEARAAHRHYCATAWRGQQWTEPGSDVDPQTLSHLLAADCLLALEDRQSLLESTCPARRLRLIRQVLRREAGFLRELRAVPVPFSQFAAEPSRN
ncbi:MAG TPA: LON peptidase substrate-binding domain-containing protein [Pseudonocardiaceae bacterium]